MALWPQVLALVLALCGARRGHDHHKHRKTKYHRQPHVLLILADDLGFNDVPWHNPAMQAPHLASLAKEGVILEQNYVQPKCAPSRAALMTGRYPFHIGRQHESLPPMMPTGLSTKYKLLPERMKEAGYATHAVGKWHLGFCAWDYTPTRRGFDSFFGFYSHSEDYYSRQSKDTSGVFSGYDLRSNESVTTEGAGLYSASLFSGKAAEVIMKHDRQTPLFLYLAFQSIHKPLQVPDEYARLYQPYGKLSKESRRRGMVTALDEAVKNVTRALKKNKMYRNTVIIFLSDNGGSYRNSNWPLRGRKNSVWEGGTRSVAFMSYPKMAEKYRGRSVNEMVHIVDWYPTILALAGYKEKVSKVDGVDQWLTLAAGWPGPRKSLIYNINDALRFTAAIRVGKWKLIWGYPEGLRSNVSRKATRAAFAQNLGEANHLDLLHLYNLEKDPNETVNLATDKTHRTTRKTLMKRVRKIMKSGEVVKPDTPFLRQKSLPQNFGGVVSPGWCTPR